MLDIPQAWLQNLLDAKLAQKWNDNNTTIAKLISIHQSINSRMFHRVGGILNIVTYIFPEACEGNEHRNIPEIVWNYRTKNVWQ